jgi:hypothetical protein
MIIFFSLLGIVMHKFRLLFLSLVVCVSFLNAADKENGGNYNGSFFERFTMPNASNVSQKKLAERRNSVPASSQSLPEKKEQNLLSVLELVRNDVTALQAKLAVLRKDFADADIEKQRQISGIEKQTVERVEQIIGSLSNAVVEVKEVPHDLQPAVDDLKSQLKGLEEKLQSAATQEEVEEFKKDLVEVCQAAQELPTVEDLVEASKQYTDRYFATKEEMTGIFVKKHEADQKVLGSLNEDLKKLNKQMPTQDNPQGFARNFDVDGRVHALKERIENLDGGDNPVVRSKALDEKLQNVATKDEIKGFVSQEVHEQALDNHTKTMEEQQNQITDHASTVSQLQGKIADLEKNSPKEQLKAGVIYFAKQGALGCVSYQLAPHMASLLRSLKLENEYVDLETVAVPTTTFAVSLLSRLAKESYQKGQDASVRDVAKESALDAGASAGVLGLRYIFFDDQMNEYVEQMSENNRTAGYAFSYATLRSLIALFV